MTIRTRNAPSPTGIPHIGNSRTALWDYLLAKKYNGQFILRLEDTDQKRFVAGSPAKIYQIHQFLGLIPDEDYVKGGQYAPYIQTQRLEIYQKYAKQLVDKGVAYQDEGAIRIKMPDDGYSAWKDLIQGKISIANKEVDDKVILKSDGIPTYHLAATVDDHQMEITHVLRGAEWIVSTPVHLFIYQSLGWTPPIFAHVPLLLGPDKTKLSKRHGAKSVLDYQAEGYLPQAINNFLFYLGFSYQDNSALLTLPEMVKIFDEERLQKQNAIFDQSKLDYFNREWIKRLPDSQLLSALAPFIPADWQADDKTLLQIIPLIKGRITTLAEFTNLAKFYFIAPTPLSNLNPEFISSAKVTLQKSDWTKDAVETNLQKLADAKNYPRKDFFMDLRLAICGQSVTPPLTESMLILGKDEILTRLEKALQP